VTEVAQELLCEPVLKDLGVSHGFGQRGSQVPDLAVFPSQVHGIEVLDARRAGGPSTIPADAVVTSAAGVSIGIVTADCVPILAATTSGSTVAAIHAGWRGLAAGVIESGLRALRSKSDGEALACAIGPAARGCCYEVDEPVRIGLSDRYREHLDEVLVSSRPGHFLLDLPLLAARILESSGVRSSQIGTLHRVCTICDAKRFESYRRDGSQAGRLKHFITRPGSDPCQG
jgi:YfiH family protein